MLRVDPKPRPNHQLYLRALDRMGPSRRDVKIGTTETGDFRLDANAINTWSPARSYPALTDSRERLMKSM